MEGAPLAQEVLAPVRALQVLDTLRNSARMLFVREELVTMEPTKVTYNGIDITDSVVSVEFVSDEQLEHEKILAAHRQAHGAMLDRKGNRLKCKNPKCGGLWHGLPLHFCEGSHKYDELETE